MRKHGMSEAKLGETFPSVSYQLEPQAVEEYARRMAVTRPVSPSTSFVPPGMLAYYALWIASSHFGFDTRGALFASMDLQFEGLASDGDFITVQGSQVEDIFIRGRRRCIVLASISVNEQNQVLCRSKITVAFKAT